ncbi:MAG: branched-chain amino acid ABC transporter permease [Lachnospiraceae bacterium]|nr:branched-chain amino acid ABC transporter permease [Lachnospiraceae bacterium]
MPKKIKRNYLINLIGLIVLFLAFYVVFESGIFGSRTNYFMGIATTACYTIIMVTSLNLLVGILGEFSLGHAGFMSVGAYASTIFSNALVDSGMPRLLLFILALLIGGIAAAITGVLVGIPTLKLRGDYLAIVTVAFAEIIRVAFTNFEITGGGRTMSGITKLSSFYWVYWVMVVCVAFMYLFIRSRFGRTVKAIREDYIAAAASGVNVTFYKVLVFTISAFFAGVAGAIYAHYITAMIPTTFNFNYSAEFLTEVIIGGTGSMTGSVIGAAFLSILPEMMRSFATYRYLGYAIVLVLIMIFRPKGVFGGWEFSLTGIFENRKKGKAGKGDE